MRRNGVCFVGYGETAWTRPKGKDRSVVQYTADVIKMALDNAGLKKQDVNGLAIAFSSFNPLQESASLAECLGFELDWLQLLDSGGAAAVVSARRAADAIQLGQVDVVVSVSAVSRQITQGPSFIADYQTDNFAVPFGHGGPPAHFALILKRYMSDHELLPEQLGKIAVAQRKNAEHNENALFRTPMTMTDYLNSRIISAPLRLFDLVAPCNGAAAFVITSERVAKKLSRNPIYLVGDGEKVNYQITKNQPDRTGIGLEPIAEELFSEVNRNEIDFVQIYDASTLVVLVQLEALGFFPKGKAGEFLDNHGLTFNGDFPLNTGGGQLSVGQASAAGGYILVVEAIRQLKGEAEGHQVRDAKTGLVTGVGLPSVADVPFCYTSAMVLQRR